MKVIYTLTLIIYLINNFLIQGLCNDNINPTEDVPVTLGEDLQGFWDMMMLQVTNVDMAFDEVNECIANDWKVSAT